MFCSIVRYEFIFEHFFWKYFCFCLYDILFLGHKLCDINLEYCVLVYEMFQCLKMY